MKIYLASSWTNSDHDSIKSLVESLGHDVFDYRKPKHSHPFSWDAVDQNWRNWKANDYLSSLLQVIPSAAFETDKTAIEEADLVLAIAPFGASVGIEIGYARGLGKPVILHIPKNNFRAELMAKICSSFTLDDDSLLAALNSWEYSLVGKNKKEKEDAEIGFSDGRKQIVIPFMKVLSPGGVGNPFFPFRSHPDDTGFDLTVDNIDIIEDGKKISYGCGLAFDFPDGICGELRARSSVHKTGLLLSNGVGTIDHGYRGEVKAVFYKILEAEPYRYGDRFAQLVIPGVDPRDVSFVEVNDIGETSRGTGGYGSTGK